MLGRPYHHSVSTYTKDLSGGTSAVIKVTDEQLVYASLSAVNSNPIKIARFFIAHKINLLSLLRTGLYGHDFHNLTRIKKISAALAFIH